MDTQENSRVMSVKFVTLILDFIDFRYIHGNQSSCFRIVSLHIVELKLKPKGFEQRNHDYINSTDN